MPNHISSRMTAEDGYYLDTILNHLKSRHNLDFSQYRKSYLYRRIHSRILHTKSSSLKDYVSFLSAHPEEYLKLIDALTINVSEFFRDKEVFEFVSDVIVKEIINNYIDPTTGTLQKKIFVWSAGASHGQEPYSLAMIFTKKFQERGIPLDMVRILATDIDDESLEKARQGIYTSKEIEAVPLTYKKFFQLDSLKKEARVEEKIKNLVSFSKSNLVLDPAPNYMDLILCRNVFIYFSKELQREIMNKLAQALNKKGFLILGKIESIFNPPSELVVFNNLHKVFQKVR